MNDKILTQMIHQFEKKHQRAPLEIHVHPVALTALALVESVSPCWRGIPVRVLEVKPSASNTGKYLGISVIGGALRCFDL